MILRLTAKIPSDPGATMVEYGLMVTLIAVVVGVAAATLGTGIATLFGNVTTSLN